MRSNDEFLSRRSPVLACGGMVASSQPLASLAGIDVLRAGGNAADAAVAVAAALQVTQPCSTGLGGDAFCLYYDAATRGVRALNGSGRSPAALTLALGRSAAGPGAARLPDQHPHSVTVPGAPAAWEDVVRTLGRLPLPAVLAPAIRLAEEGFPVAPCAARWWQGGAEHQLRRHRHGHELMIAGRGPRPGEVIRLPALANSLRTLAEEGSAPFYRGRIAQRIVAALREEGGVMSPADLAEHRSQWVEPISIDYRGLRVWQCPPNGQGLAVLLALGVVAQFDLADFPASTFRRYHLLIEAMRLAFADAAWAVADPDFAAIPLAELLSPAYAARRAAGIDLSRANRAPAAGMSPGGGPACATPHLGTDTVYFCTADADGNACSFINSNYMGFGTGIVPEGCGYSLQNRGCGFVLSEGHPNALAPRKRPYHTIIPGLLTHADGDLFGPFGVMGGWMQPQGHLQVVVALADDDLDPQSALDRPRFQLAGGNPGGAISVEDALPAEVVSHLAAAGHEPTIVRGADRSSFGLGQVIRREPPSPTTGRPVLWAGSDGRGDGMAIGIP